jgi:beta-galactosidase
VDAPGPLAHILGIRIDETDALAPEVLNSVLFDDARARCAANLVFDLVQPGTAEVIGVYESDFYAGMAAVTRNVVGTAAVPGEAWYVGTNLAAAGLDWLFGRVLGDRGLRNGHSGLPGVEAVTRCRGDVTYLFLLNHGDADAHVVADLDSVSLLTRTPVRAGESITLAPKGVAILKAGRDDI